MRAGVGMPLSKSLLIRREHAYQSSAHALLWLPAAEETSVRHGWPAAAAAGRLTPYPAVGRAVQASDVQE